MKHILFPKRSKFKAWVTRKWEEHNYEVRLFERRPVKRSQEQWFNDNKWFLKTEYKKARNRY
jgi:hypothetical protein